MIVEALVDALFVVIDWLLALLPVWTPVDLSALVDVVVDKFGPLFGILAWADFYAPVAEALAMFGFLAALWLSVLVFRAVLWVLRGLHLVGG